MKTIGNATWSDGSGACAVAMSTGHTKPIQASRSLSQPCVQQQRQQQLFSQIDSNMAETKDHQTAKRRGFA
eukprot:4942236-Amphidinium_carterae.1